MYSIRGGGYCKTSAILKLKCPSPGGARGGNVQPQLIDRRGARNPQGLQPRGDTDTGSQQSPRWETPYSFQSINNCSLNGLRYAVICKAGILRLDSAY